MDASLRTARGIRICIIYTNVSHSAIHLIKKRAIHNPGKQIGSSHTRLRRYISPILRAPVHIVVIIHLVQLRGVSPAALDRRVDMPIPHQRLPDLGIRIRLRGAGHDARVLEEGVRVQGGEELQRLLEEVDHLLRRHVVGVARGVEGADAGAVLAPFVLPE